MIRAIQISLLYAIGYTVGGIPIIWNVMKLVLSILVLMLYAYGICIAGWHVLEFLAKNSTCHI